MRQIYFSENILPKLNDVQKDTYSQWVNGGNQEFPIGKGTATRQLVRLTCYREDITKIIEFLNDLGKELIVCGCFDKDGNIDTDFSYDKVEYASFFVPYEIDTEFGKQMYAPASNVLAGWSDFK